MSETGDARYAPPQAQLEDPDRHPPGTSGNLARRSTRLWAALVDGVIQGAIAFGLLSVVPGSWLDIRGGMLSFSWQLPIIGLLLFTLLHGYLLATRGQTIGKALFGIRIVRSDGSPASLGRLIGLRYGPGLLAAAIQVLSQVYGLLDVLLIFGQSRRCLHDYIADTIVVEA